MYQLEITKTAHHQLRQLSPINLQRVHQAIEQLSRNPRPNGVKKLKGEVDFYRIRVGNYGILYEINDAARLISIERVISCENAY